MSTPPLLTVLVTAFNEAPSIAPLYQRFQATLDPLNTRVRWQVVFIDNGSSDGTATEVRTLRARDPRVKLLALSRNFGYHGAMLAGLSEVESDLYALVDADGEDPPELLGTFLSSIEKGTQLAYGIRSDRSEAFWMTALRGLFYQLNRWIADSETVVWMGEFAMFTRPVRDAVLVSRTTFPFLRYELAYIGFQREGIPYKRGRRAFGKSHFNPLQMLRYAVAGFLSSSTFPLRATLYVAFGCAVGLPIAAAIGKWGPAQTAFWAILVGFYFLLWSLAMIALYLARTYKNTLAQPRFVVDRQKSELV